MPNYSTIQHSLQHIGEIPNELDIEWDSHTAGRVSAIAFDRLGKYCAIYSDLQKVSLCSIESILLRQSYLPLSERLKKESYACISLSWSYDAYYLIGNFLKRTMRRKNKDEASPTISSVLIIWDIAKQLIMQEIYLPFSIYESSALPNLRSPSTAAMQDEQREIHSFLFSASSLDSTYRDTYYQHIFFVIETGYFQPVEEIFSESIKEWRLSSEVFGNVSIEEEEEGISRRVRPIGSYDLKANIKDRKENAFRLSPVFACFPSARPQGTDSFRQTCNLFLLHENFQLHLTSNLSVLQFEYQLANDDFAPVKTLSVNFQVQNCISIAEDLSRQAIPQTKHRFVDSIIFSSSQEMFFLGSSHCGIVVYSFTEEPRAEEEKTAFQVTKLIDYYFDSKVYNYYGIHFANCSFLQYHSQYDHVASVSKVPFSNDLLIMNRFHKLQNQSSLVIWNYLQDYEENQRLRRSYPQLQAIENVPIRKYSITSRSFQKVFPRTFLQPIPQQNLPSQTYPLLLGIDSMQKLWSCSLLCQSDFAGAMFPIGYKIIHQIKTYIEREDELDYVVPKKKENQQATAIDTSDIDSNMEVDCIEESVLKKNDQPLIIDFDVQCKSENHETYLKTLPFDLSSFLSEGRYDHQPSFHESRMMDDNEEFDEDEDGETERTANSVIDDSASIEWPGGDGKLALSNIEESQNEEEEEVAHKRKKKKRTIFPATLDFYLPAPNRVVTGDFINKLNRERQYAQVIQDLNENPAYIEQRFMQVQQESIKNVIRSTLVGIRKKRVLEERRSQREQNKKSVLENLLKDYDETIKKIENDRLIRQEVTEIVGEMVGECEKRIYREIELMRKARKAAALHERRLREERERMECEEGQVPKEQQVCEDGDYEVEEKPPEELEIALGSEAKQFNNLEPMELENEENVEMDGLEDIRLICEEILNSIVTKTILFYEKN